MTANRCHLTSLGKAALERLLARMPPDINVRNYSELGRLTGIHRTTIKKIRDGQKPFREKTFEALFEALNDLLSLYGLGEYREKFSESFCQMAESKSRQNHSLLSKKHSLKFLRLCLEVDLEDLKSENLTKPQLRLIAEQSTPPPFSGSCLMCKQLMELIEPIDLTWRCDCGKTMMFKLNHPFRN